MKKLIYVLLILFVLSAVIVSCGGGGGGGGGVAPTTETTTTASNPATTTTNTSSTYFGTKSPTDPKAVNDIVFSDGSATPYTSGLTLTAAQKNAAVAMIFYKGTECSNNGSTRTLGVGLKRSSSGMQWCWWICDTNCASDADCANGYNNNIDTIQCNPSGGSGSYTFTGVKDGSDNLSQIAAFLAGNNDTGTEANYPAFYWAKNYGTTNGCTGAYASGWYLPSIAELYQIYKLKANIDAAVALCGLTNTFSSTSCWSSSQYENEYGYTCFDDYAYFFLFTNGACCPDFKNRNYSVCAVRAF